MTLALIVLVIFLVVWFNQSAKNKSDKQAHRKRTQTNVKLQDELNAKNFTLIINDLIALDKEEPLVGEKLIDAIESLFDKYDIPDMRDDTQRINDRREDLIRFIGNEEMGIIQKMTQLYHSKIEFGIARGNHLFLIAPNY